MPSDSSLDIPDPEVQPAADHDSLFSRARAQWLVGDWQPLSAVLHNTIERHPRRETIAILVACANLQIGEGDRAREFLKCAISWGCDQKLAARLLVSGVHNTFGRMGALLSDDRLAERHFSSALSLANDTESQSAVHMRAVKEMAALGLLPQAASLLQTSFDSIRIATARPMAIEAKLQTLKTEVDLLQHEISLAHQRNQLPLQRNPSDASPDQDSIELLRTRSPSQLGQDLWVLERSGYKRHGYFVEFGATDGVRLSNTYLLEREFAWDGVCAEPNPRLYKKLTVNRRCRTSNACIGRRTGEDVEFILADEYGGMVRDIANDQHFDKRRAYLDDAANHMLVSTVSLNDFLESVNAPRRIDYISIDTEGSEYEILREFPFQLWDVRLMTVEHNFTPRRDDIKKLLEDNGYQRTEAQWDDWYERIPP